MRVETATVLLTGSAGGIGSAIAKKMSREGARLLLVDLDEGKLEQLETELSEAGASVTRVAADITNEAGRAKLVDRARKNQVNVLINAAGLNPFGFLETQASDQIAMTIDVNVLAPILLCRDLIPILKGVDSAHIVNIGSSFGSIGYPAFAAYSASKFAMRGFSEALRRELSDAGIRVHYVAPRATRTRLATDRIRAMNQELKVRMDEPEVVAKAVVKVLRRERSELSLGLNERIYAKVNGLAPRLIDFAVARQLPTIRRFAESGSKSRQISRSASRLNTMEIHR